MIGKTISHYTILEKLGEGGMGVVYKAEDTKLRRTVALKFLSHQTLGAADERARFIHEAQAAAALNHTNICTVHEIEESEDHAFIAMEYVDGKSLEDQIEAGPLNINMAIDTAIQIAQGLQEAHENNIVHRDIKPSNVMLSAKGQAKIMDFGLARASGRTKLTKEGTTLGTVAYMSPEQVSGKEIDNRSDIWSFGVVLYEMIVGETPFRGDYDQAIFYAIMNEEPEPVTALRTGVPMDLERIIDKALAKDPAERYQHLSDMLVDLRAVEKKIGSGVVTLPAARRGKSKTRWILIPSCIIAVIAVAAILWWRFIAPSMPQKIDSIAVLPLKNLSGDPEQEYFAYGMTEALITELAKIGALDVISRTSVMRYKDTDKTLPEIARELNNVDAIVEGSVFREGQQVRITVQLIQASKDRHLWTDTYDREWRDILTLHSEVAQAIAREIRVVLTPQEQVLLSRTRPVNPEAHDLYLKGKYHYDKGSEEGTERAIEYFQKAVEADSSYAQAYAMLAASYEFYWFFGKLPLDETKRKVEALIDKAIGIDDTIVEAYIALAGKRFYMDWDWLGGEKAIKRALELNPNSADAHYDYAYHLIAMSRYEEAIYEMKRSMQLDPGSYEKGKWLAWMYRQARMYDKAIAQYRWMAELEPDRPDPYWWLQWTYEAMGRYEDAIMARKEAAALSKVPSELIAAAALDSAYNESGPRGYWMWRLERIMKSESKDNSVMVSSIYAQLGDMDKAFEYLEKAYEKHEGYIYLLNVSPSLDPLRGDPRFQDMLRRVNFPDSEAQ